MANVSDRIGQAAFPDQMLPEASADAAYSDGSPYAPGYNSDQKIFTTGDNGQSSSRYANPNYDPNLPSMNKLPPVVSEKQAQVKAASDAKRLAMGGLPTGYEMAVGRLTGDGDKYMSEREKDIRTLDPMDLYTKYGSEAKDMIAGIANSGNEVGLDRGRADRSLLQQSADSSKSIGQGFVNGLAGLANLGIGAVNANAGATVAKAIQTANEYVDGTKSEALQGNKRVQEAMNTLDQRDSRVQETVDISNGASPLMAGLSRIGRDALSSVQNAGADTSTLIDGTANAVGSILSAGPLSKAIKGVGGALIPEATKRGVGLAGAMDAAAGNLTVARGLAAIGSEAPILASIGLQEGGGAYQQLTADIAGRSFEQLNRESKPFRDLVAGGMSKEDARNQVANDAGIKAGLMTAPAAALLGKVVSKFEGDPFAAKSARTVIGNLGRETIEEGSQGGTGQLAQNYAEKLTANQNKNLTDNVGRQVGEGALYGFGAAGLVQAPTIAKLAVKGTADVAGGVVNAVGGTVAQRAEALNKANEAASPLSSEKVNQQADEAVQTQPVRDEVVNQAINEVEAAPEVKEQMSENLRRLNNVASFSPDEISPKAANWVRNSTNRAQAMDMLATIVAKTDPNSAEHMEAALSILRLQQPAEELNEADFSTFDSLPEDSQAKSAINEMLALQGRISQTPSVIAALQKARTVLDSYNPAPVTEASLQTPEGQQGVQDSIAVATAAPEKGNLEANEQILYHAAQGRINITPQQKAALDTSVAILRAAQSAAQEVQRLGNDSASAQVGREVTVEKGDKGPSALDHAKGIMSAWKAGNKDLARGRLFEMSEFVQHMQNKVDALNRHFEAGSPRDKVQYEARRSTGEWFTTKGDNGLAVHPKNAGSVRFAQNVAVEAKVLTDVYNGLVTAFPDLEGQHVVGTPLNDSLMKPAGQVVGNSQPKPVVTPAPAADATNTPVAKPSAPAEIVKSVAEKKPTPVEPKAEQAPIVEPSTTKETQPEPKLTGIRAVYPQLIGSSDNHFAKAFVVPEGQQSRTVGSDSPIQTIRDALKSQDSLSKFTESNDMKGELTPEIARAYQEYLRPLEGIVDALNDSLTTFVNKGSNLTKIQSGEALGWANGKAANIAEEVDGEIRYNPELIETAALASLQWSLSLDQLGSVMDAKDLSSLTGLAEASLSPTMIENLNQGIGKDEAKQSLAQKISNYWGVRANPDSGIGFTRGIPEAVAAEILDLYVQKGLFHEVSYIVRKDGSIEEYAKGSTKPVEGEKTIDRLLTTEELETKLTRKKTKREKTPLDDYPDAIERAVMVEPEGINFIDQENLPVARTQLRNAIVENTPQQIETIKNEQATPYRVNHTVAAVYQAFGVDNLVRLFGAGQFDPEEMNENHAKSLDGQNRSVVSAFNGLEKLLGQLSNQAGDRAITDVPVRYQFNMTRVSRAQMLGKFNPQSSKLVREVMMPTESTLDMSNTNGQDYNRFMLGVAQSFGIKVHKMSQPQSRLQAEAMINGALSPVLDALERAFNNYEAPTGSTLGSISLDSDLVDVMQAGFKAAGADLTPHALHAVTQLAWLRHQTPEQLKSFKTSLYLEADGVTNGPINGMVLLTAGNFTEDWVRNIGKGGLYFNRGAETVNSHNEFTDPQDAYQATTNELETSLTGLRTELENGNPKAADQMKHMLTLMDEFLGKDLNFDAEGNLELSRGIAKNPLTVTIYGAGEGGIAAKMSSLIVDGVYERMSEVLQGTNTFSPAVREALNALISNKITEGEEGLRVKDSATGRKGQYDPKTFSFTSEELANIRSNLKFLFVKPMRTAIENTVGSSLLQSAEMVRQATQAQSIVLESAFKAEVTAMMDAKAKADPAYRRSDLLSQKELNGIYKKLEHLAPLIKSPTQTFFVAGNESVSVDKLYIGQAFNDRFRTNAQIYGPSNAGVSGIPFLNIGAGDGQMMQNISTHPDAPTGTLKVFDGINLPLDQIESGSRVANEAVWDSWMGNPLRYVHDSYSQFMKNADLGKFDEDTRKALSEAMFGLGKTEGTQDEIVQAMSNLTGRLLEGHQQVEARHRTMALVQTSTDQMASAASPHVRPGTVELYGTDNASIAAQLQTIYEGELAKIQKQQPSESIGSAVEDLATKDSSGASVLYPNDLTKLTKRLNLPAEQQQVLNQLNESLATKGYKVVYGSRDQVAQFIQSEGGTVPSAGGDVFGFTAIGSKTIYLNTPSAETLVHELVHAATFENVLGHYSDPAFSAKNPQAAKAVQRIEALMNQFMNLELTQVSPELTQAFNDAKSAINGYLLAEPTAQNKASALNEFMAWGLTNRSLIGLGQRTRASKLAQLASNVFDAIKSMFFRGNRTAPAKGTDMFSNLLFNSAVLMKSAPTGRANVQKNVLFQNSIYGDDQRIANIASGFANTVARYMERPLVLGEKLPSAVVQESVLTAYRVAESFMTHGFGMNMQQSSAFNQIVAALATQAKIDPNSMAAAQDMYQHVLRTMKVEDFIDPTTQDAGQAQYDAQEKFDLISGLYHTEKDNSGRSTLLPAFLALSVVSDQFRSVLEKFDLPKNAKETEGSKLDQVLTDKATDLMDRLSATMSGTRKAKNVKDAMDGLAQHIADMSEQTENFIETSASKIGGISDYANDVVVNGMTVLSRGLLDIDEKARARGANKLTRIVTGFGAGIGAIVNEQSGEKVSAGVMKALNNSNVWPGFRELIGDITGRTPSNATIYDMIKAVRSMVQQARQQFRENLPAQLENKFTRKLSKQEWSSLFTSMGKTDLAVLRNHFSQKDINEMLTKNGRLKSEIKTLEDFLQGEDSIHFGTVRMKANQLAKYMLTQQTSHNLLRNAEAVSQLFGEGKSKNFQKKGKDYINAVDQLVTMYALQKLNQEDKDTLSSLVQTEANGIGFTMSYMVGQRTEEQNKALTSAARLNHFKGHIPTAQKNGVSLLVANDTEFADLTKQSYVRLGSYTGHSRDRGAQNKSYYFAPVAARAGFEQGIMQNVRQTVSGVDATTGYSLSQSAGRITEPAAVKAMAARWNDDKSTKEHMMPVYNSVGDVVAFERSLNPEILSRTLDDQHLAKQIGVWRGRQVEEATAQKFNEGLLDALSEMYRKDLKASASNKSQYVNVLKTSDAVLSDALKLMNVESRDYAEGLFGKDELWVRKDMLNDAFGYRAASIGDAWTGTSRWSEKTQESVKNLAISAFGNKAYQYAVNGEQVLKNFVSDAKVLIVVKSVIVPVSNLISNVYQLVGRGVPLASVVKGFPKKTAEVDGYVKSKIRQIEAEAELRAATDDPVATRKLKTEIQTISDSHKRMSIWPLIQAGEFTAISDASLTRDEIMLTSGRLQQYVEQQVNKLPTGISTLGRYAMITKDTALFKGLQKSVEYGDFLAKAVLYDDLVDRKKMTPKQALARVTEEFVNYDRLPGRTRGSLEGLGLLWFYNFKIRSVKVAMSMIRNNPVHTLLATLAPAPSLFGKVGLPTMDNLFVKLADGTLDYSMGPGQGLRAPQLNPWLNLIP